MGKLALTCGDPAGVGPEIVARWLAENPGEAENVVAVGPRKWLASLPCAGVPVGNDDFVIAPGAPSAEGQRVALAAMERAAAGTLAGEFSGVVTAPVNKAGLKSVGYGFPGQTEFFAARWGGVPVMAFAGGRLAVVLATWHIPLRDVPAALTEETLSRAVSAAAFLAERLGPGRSGVSPLRGADERDGEAAGRRFSQGERLDEAAGRRFSRNIFYDPSKETLRREANLPHWEQEEKVYFLTFRLADSVPRKKLNEWIAARESWLEKHPFPHDEKMEEEYCARFVKPFDGMLDAGYGSCCLRDEKIREIVAGTLRHFDGGRYELFSFVVMPNHVHVLFRVFEGNSLAEIVHSWKSFSAKKINAVLGTNGALWQKEYWDRLVRSENHFRRCEKYISENPGNSKIPVWRNVSPSGRSGVSPLRGADERDGEAAGRRFSQGERLDEAAGRRFSIGVCGLNPHAGEQGILGREEIEIIEPVLEKLRARFPGLSRCVPADTIFARQLRGEFDVVVALYHDQALAPLKTLEFDEAVNVSLGLPHVRTSPDHGTAYDIAGRGVARTKSFANAVRLAKLLCSRAG